MRYLAAFLAVLCILAAALTALFWCVTTEEFALAVNSSEKLIACQQVRINRDVSALTERWQLDASRLTMWTEDAARRHGKAVAAWWGALWQDPAAEKTTPAWLSSSDESRLVTDVRGDAGFIALTPEDQRRAIARDEVAYALDEAVCDAVMPLRRSIVEMGISLLSDVIPLPLIRQASLIASAALLLIALVLLLLARRAAGSTLIASGMMLVLVSLPVYLMFIPDMLGEMNAVAELQAELALDAMGQLWYGAAGALAVLGLLILCLKRIFRGRKKSATAARPAEEEA